METLTGYDNWKTSEPEVDGCVSCGADKRLDRDGLCKSCFESTKY